MLGKGTVPGARESKLVSDHSIAVLNTWSAGTGKELLSILVEGVIDFGAAHIGAKTGTLRVTTWRAKIL